jgi:thiamine-monophosphate kinase
VADIGERRLLAAIARRLGGGSLVPASRSSAGVLVGVGDDAAVMAPMRGSPVLTADLLVEGVDFEWKWARPADVGHKAASVNLSDLAAMGARPRALLLSLALRPEDRVRDVLALISAVHRQGLRYGAPLVGGDLSATAGPMVVAVTAVGETEGRPALRRYRARAGDRILVSGSLGAAAAGLRLLLAGLRAPPSLAARQLKPEPRIALGLALARSRLVRSCADVSDGVAGDASHLVPPGLTVELDPSRLPIDDAVRSAAARLGVAAEDLALAGGEDFELVLAAPPEAVPQLLRLSARLGVPLTDIGMVRRGRRITLRQWAFGAPPAFEHFRRSGRSTSDRVRSV